MFKNYLRVALRSLTRNKFSATINIGGLAIGMSIALLIGLWVYDELTFDHSTPNHKKIAAVLSNEDFNGIKTWWSSPLQMAPVLRKDYGSLFKYVALATIPNDYLLTYGDKKIKPTGNYIEPQAIDLLGLKMLRGNNTALQDPSSIILSASTVRDLFGDDEPLGKTIILDKTKPVKVTGVYADLPANSSFAERRFMAPWQLIATSEDYETKLTWGNHWFNIYVELNDNIDINTASKTIKDIYSAAPKTSKNDNRKAFLHPLDRWHLYSEFKDGVCVGGRIRYVRLYSLIGIFILLLACINFMNLSTARSEKRAKEVGIRKALGSLRSQLIRQFFGESMLIALLSFIFAIGIAQLLLPFFNDVAGKKLSIPYGSPIFWLAGLLFALLTGLLAGSYPALYLSSFKPIKVLKGVFKVGPLAALPRKALVVIQFTVSVILIVGTLAVLHQIQYAKDRPVGYSRAGLLTVPLHNVKPGAQLTTLRQDLKATGFIQDIAGSESSAANTWNTNSGFTWAGKDPQLKDEFVTNGITPEFGQVIGWQMTAGRDFSRDFGTDSNALIINESAAKYMGLRDPVGQTVRWGNNGLYTIIGVSRDMIAESPYSTIPPMIFYVTGFLDFSSISVIDIRIKPQKAMSPALAAIGEVFKKFDPEDPFQYQFVDEEYAMKFGEEERIARLAGFFTLLAILISCLGLLGLSAFVAEQRTREVSIRKVLGASILDLWNLLSKEFVLLVSLSLLIGGPISFLLMKSWLQNYEYHAAMSWWIFALTALGAISITLLTVSFQTIRAALANPINSLRTE